MTMKDQDHGWAIVRFAPGTGLLPADDEAHIDCFYHGDGEAWGGAIYRDWCRRYPNYTVALVEAREVRFTDVAWRRSKGAAR